MIDFERFKNAINNCSSIMNSSPNIITKAMQESIKKGDGFTHKWCKDSFYKFRSKFLEVYQTKNENFLLLSFADKKTAKRTVEDYLNTMLDFMELPIGEWVVINDSVSKAQALANDDINREIDVAINKIKSGNFAIIAEGKRLIVYYCNGGIMLPLSHWLKEEKLEYRDGDRTIALSESDITRRLISENLIAAELEYFPNKPFGYSINEYGKIIFNTFKDYNYLDFKYPNWRNEEISDESKKLMEDLFEAVKENICSSSSATAYWLIKFFANRAINPFEISNIGFIVKGPLQGIGKNFFFGDIMRMIMGDEYIRETNLSTLKDTFNSGLEHCRVMIFDEVTEKGEGTQSKTVREIIKSFTSTHKKYLNAKFKTPYNAFINAIPVFCSNHVKPLSLDIDDRRFVIFNTKNVVKFSELAQRIVSCDEFPIAFMQFADQIKYSAKNIEAPTNIDMINNNKCLYILPNIYFGVEKSNFIWLAALNNGIYEFKSEENFQRYKYLFNELNDIIGQLKRNIGEASLDTSEIGNYKFLLNINAKINYSIKINGDIYGG